jgi:hypothetical protein
MIPLAMLHTLCFPWMLVSSTGELIDTQDGTLFKLSAGARQRRSTAYCGNAPAGWSRCPIGYAVYCREVPAMGKERLVLHGLKVTGVSTIIGKSDSLSIKTNKAEIENYVTKTFMAFVQVEDYLTNIVRRSVHEVRNINKDIKIATEDILNDISCKDIHNDGIRIRTLNIKSLSEILTSQTDFLDYFVNPAIALFPDRGIQVHNKIFKTRESLGTRAAAKGISIRLYGRSDGQIAGRQVFEVIPFILIENAIKYSPDNQCIDIIFRETEEHIFVTFRNIGPSLDDSEIEHVFDMGRRGTNAEAAKISGYGIGLHVAKELVEQHHAGKIEFGQAGEVRVFGGVEYRTTEIALSLPRVR